jgi:hypothetical protein
MPKNADLPKKRNAIKTQLKGFHTLPERILDGFGALVRGRRFDASPLTGLPSYWISGGLIAALTFLLGWGVSAARGEHLTGSELSLMMWAAATGALALVANKVNMRLFLDTFRESLLDKMLSIDDIEDLHRWLKANFTVWKPLLSGLLFGPLLAFLLYQNWLSRNPASYHAGTFVIILLAGIQAVWVVYYFYPFYVSLPSRLSEYHYDIYATDPSSSEVVGQLSKLLTYILYITMAYIVQLTVGLAVFNVLSVDTGLFFALFVWAPTVMLYAAGQFHLSDLIAREKWKILNEIQTKIEALYAQEQIPQQATLQRLGQLMDYHDRIKNTPNSALNFRSGLNFLNSLLLPVLAFIAANLDKVIATFKAALK